LLSLEDVTWYAGDSNEVLDDWVQRSWFSYELSSLCWPWKYSDDPKDLSNMDYADFKEVYFNH
jgi:hypothetical protein